MDFWYCFQIQKEKLKCSITFGDLLDENGKIIFDGELFEEFRSHLPVASEEFWQTLVNIIFEYERNEDFQVDEGLMEYVLILICWYTDECLSQTEFFSSCSTTALLALQFYFKLMTLVDLKYFKSCIYKSALICLEKFCGHGENLQQLRFLKSMRQFLVFKEISKKYLEMTLVQLCHVIDRTSTKIFTNFSTDETTDLAHEALLCIRSLATQNRHSKAHSMINYTLLHGIRSESCSEQVKRNFRNLLSDLKPILRTDNFSNFQNVFFHVIVKSETVDAMEACRFITNFDEHFFKDTVLKLTTIAVSKEVSNKNNILKLFAHILEHLPTNFYEPSKLEILIHSLYNICVMNCINNDEAITLVARICLLHKQIINKQFEILLSTPTEYIYVENSLPTFCMKFNMHWLDRIKNRNIAVIILRIMSNTYDITSDEKYAGILEMIGNEADPSDLKICIPILVDLLRTSKRKNSKHVAQKIIDIIYSMAIHSSSGSSEFIKTIFQLILEPSEQFMPYKSEIIASLSSQIILNHKVFINKAYELKLFEPHCIKKMISSIMRGDYDGIRFACATVDKVSSPQGEKLIYHLMANPTLLSEAKYIGDLLFIVNSGLKYFISYQRNMNLSPVQRNNLKEFSKLLWRFMLKFSLPYYALGVSQDVMKSLSELTEEPVDFQELFQAVNFELKRALQKLPSDTYSIPIMYSAELICNHDYTVPEECIQLLETILTKTFEVSRSQGSDDNVKMHTKHYYCLVLMVRLSMKHSRLGSKTMNYLKSTRQETHQEFKMHLMDLMYDLCIYVVHNFDEFLEFCFNDLKSIDFSRRKQAATYIEHFIRLDYLKPSMEQYCKFIILLGDPVIEKDIQNLIINFILTNQAMVEKYFLALIMHVNFYSVHLMCPMSPQYMQDMNCIIRANFNKWKVFATLFRSLPLRSKFLILKEICTSFFDKFIRGKMKLEDGIWNVMTDSISVFKIMAYNSLDNIKYEVFYDKGIEEIRKYLIEKTISPEVPLKYPVSDMKSEIPVSETLSYEVFCFHEKRSNEFIF
ncbi:hypothetical protein HHI36_017000 [Cryptolaemus montrouzieri]|uniref:Uncharacterized protein n=1 Tax=Cryptolaemus montrouzieri TaxID=559131 RepID=A0ABD2NLK7_9CUCU